MTVAPTAKVDQLREDQRRDRAELGLLRRQVAKLLDVCGVADVR
jgi:hypothetical protein